MRIVGTYDALQDRKMNGTANLPNFCSRSHCHTNITMIKKIYVETSIPSFYFNTRSQVEMEAKKKWTRQWWEKPKPLSNLVTSFPVIVELQQIPNPEKRQKTLELISTLPMLEYTEEIDEIVDVYISHKLMPNQAMGDATHLALASFYKCDFLVTWNCRHLANANKFDHIRRINGLLGLFSPVLLTPLELLEDEENED